MSSISSGVSTPRMVAAFSAVQNPYRTLDTPGSASAVLPSLSITRFSAAVQNLKSHPASGSAQNRSSSKKYLKLAISQMTAIAIFYFGTAFYLERDGTIPIEVKDLFLHFVIVALLISSCLVSLVSLSKPRFSDTRTVAGEIEPGLEHVDMDPVASLSAAGKRHLIREPRRFSPMKL